MPYSDAEHPAKCIMCGDMLGYYDSRWYIPHTKNTSICHGCSWQFLNRSDKIEDILASTLTNAEVLQTITIKNLICDENGYTYYTDG